MSAPPTPVKPIASDYLTSKENHVHVPNEQKAQQLLQRFPDTPVVVNEDTGHPQFAPTNGDSVTKEATSHRKRQYGLLSLLRPGS